MLQKKFPSSFVNQKKISLEISDATEELEKCSMLIYGSAKLGKTTFLMQFPNNYFMMCERNNTYKCYRNYINNWEDFSGYTEDFIRGNHKYNYCTIDNPSVLDPYCIDYFKKKYDCEHPGLMYDHGGSWSRFKFELHLPIRKLINSNFGFFACAKEDIVTVKGFSGITYDKIAPKMTGSLAQVLVDEIHNIFYYRKIGNRRYLQIQPDETIVAGNRFEKHFLTEKGEKIYLIDLGSSPEQAYKSFIRAYNNQQLTTGMEVVSPLKEKQLTKRNLV